MNWVFWLCIGILATIIFIIGKKIFDMRGED